MAGGHLRVITTGTGEHDRRKEPSDQCRAWRSGAGASGLGAPSAAKPGPRDDRVRSGSREMPGCARSRVWTGRDRRMPSRWTEGPSDSIPLLRVSTAGLWPRRASPTNTSESIATSGCHIDCSSREIEALEAIDVTAARLRYARRLPLRVRKWCGLEALGAPRSRHVPHPVRSRDLPECVRPQSVTDETRGCGRDEPMSV